LDKRSRLDIATIRLVGGHMERRVTFGWRIPEFPVDGAQGREFISQVSHSLERVQGNLDVAWLCDHMIPWPSWQSPETDTLEGWTTISYFAGIFKKISFGNVVLCNSYRNPALLAKMAATLCALAPRRFILGIGAGWMEEEYLSYGYKFPSARTRIEALEEAVQIIRRMWVEESVHFKGRHYDIDGARCSPKPDPMPPILVGGGGEKRTLRVVAAYADWWNHWCPIEEYTHKLHVLEQYCGEVGRTYEDIKRTWLGCVAIARTESEARTIAKRNPFNMESPTILGNPEQVTSELQKFVDIGVEHFILRFLDFPSTKGVELFNDTIVREFV
jgi:alkanesulfonate monooxygenase SsuD/methylene tetrahydromethanopterin reductase-like flavin-dependent oxidoreductase (luciferase family)